MSEDLPPPPVVFESGGNGIHIRIELSGYDEFRDRPVFLGIAQMTASIAMGLRDYGSNYGLRIGPILIETINILQQIYFHFKNKPGGLQQ